MSISASELIAYASADLPTDDVSTTGGAIDLTRRPVFTDLTANSSVDIVSDGTDTRNVTITGRGTNGSVIQETLALNNTSTVDGANTYERIEKVEAATTSSTRTITVIQHSTSATISTIPPTEIGFYRMFRNSASSTSGTSNRYEKFFYYNSDASLNLLSASVTLTASPGNDANHTIQIGLSTAQNDTGTVTNRTTAPAGVTFVGLNTAQNVPGTDLGSTSEIGVWVEQTLAANASALKSTFTTQLAGSST